MTDNNSFGILGGDGRQIALAESIASDGYAVRAYGFDSVSFSEGVRKSGLRETVEHSENIILPLPVTSDGTHLKMDCCDDRVVLDDAFAELLRGKLVFGGRMGKLYRTSELWDSIDACDYCAREEFAVRNAVPTAEGALETAMHEYPGTVHGSRCLVAGFGRLGKTIAWMLRGIGADVAVSARTQPDLAWIESFGYRALPADRLGEGTFDLVFNTVPYPIFSRPVMRRMKCRPLLIDLASPPGGVDPEAAEETGVRVIRAPSLPGKVAPKAAGEIIKRTIYAMMEE